MPFIKTEKDFIEYKDRKTYDFREQIVEFEPEADETARYVVYQAIGIAEEDQRHKNSEDNLAYKEAKEIYEKQKIIVPNGEADNCELLQKLCRILYDDDTISCCTDKNRIIIDTMNSWTTTCNRLMSLHSYGRWSKRKSIYLYANDNKEIKSIFDHTSNACSFLKQAYVIGNFIPAPLNRPLSPIRDYWDLTLYYIYHWYQTGDDQNIAMIVGKSQKNIEKYKMYLLSFQDLAGNAGWEVFVDKTYQQHSVQREGGKYREPIEFWDGHFSGNVMPTDLKQIESFCERAGDMIAERSKIMISALEKRMNL